MAAEKGYALQDILTSIFERVIEMDLPGEVMVWCTAIRFCGTAKTALRTNGSGVLMVLSFPPLVRFL